MKILMSADNFLNKFKFYSTLLKHFTDFLHENIKIGSQSDTINANNKISIYP